MSLYVLTCAYLPVCIYLPDHTDHPTTHIGLGGGMVQWPVNWNKAVQLISGNASPWTIAK